MSSKPKNFERLKAHILQRSTADNFYLARREWSVTSIYLDDAPIECPCGQTIFERCYITNHTTGERTIVGNVCVKHFMGMDLSPLFSSAKRIRKDTSKSPNKALLAYAIQMRLINEWEAQFLKDTMGKRKLSEKQTNCRERINTRILAAISS
jgi:hypothetical protein